MKNYELTYLISPDLSEEEAKAVSQRMADLATNELGLIKTNPNPEKIKLAYAIKKKNSAYLATLHFSLAPDKIADIEKKIKPDPQILRYIILNEIEYKKPASAPRKSKRITAGESNTLPEIKSAEPKPESKKAGIEEIDREIEEILK